MVALDSLLLPWPPLQRLALVYNAPLPTLCAFSLPYWKEEEDESHRVGGGMRALWEGIYSRFASQIQGRVRMLLLMDDSNSNINIEILATEGVNIGDDEFIRDPAATIDPYRVDTPEPLDGGGGCFSYLFGRNFCDPLMGGSGEKLDDNHNNNQHQ